MRNWCLGALVVTAILSGRAATERPGVSGDRSQAPQGFGQLDRYLSGAFESVMAEVAARKDFDGLLNDLLRDGPAWIAAGSPETQPRRRLAAATFALEAARAAGDEDWKWIQWLRDLKPPQPPSIWWKTPPQLIEWACGVARGGGVPPDVERIWHLAAIAVAERRSDYEFLLGSMEEFGGENVTLTHLPHVASRFPDEPRFALAQAIALEWRTWPLTAKHPRTSAPNLADAMRAFDRPALLNDAAVGAEAAVRLGVLRLRGRNPGGALELFDRAERRTRDRYLVYLARFFSGQARERQNRPADAERAYRGALATIPKAISATMALAAVLTRAGRISEATSLVEEALTASPPVVDPWRTYAAADDRFWPVLIARLHAEIGPKGSGESETDSPSPRTAGAGPSEAEGPDTATDPPSAPPPQAPQQSLPQQPVFRGRTDLVTIDVSVRSQGTPVAGLTAKDFVLLDNGLPQTVEQIEMEAVPVDVSILVDMNEDLADDMAGMAAQIPRIIAMLRPDDRVRVTAINTYVTDLVPAQTAATVPPLGRLGPSGLSSAHDGLAAALLRGVDPNRRHLVVALTNGIDAVSALDALAVRDIARHSSATLYIAQIDMALDPVEGAPAIYLSGRQRRDRDRCMATGICSPTRRFWQPFGDYEFPTLTEAAELTGGKLYLPGIFTDRTAAAIFKKVFEDYRRSYLLRYTPQGTPAPGWHEAIVTIPGYPSYEVQARRGYFVEPPGRGGGSSSPENATAGFTPPIGARPARSDAATIDDLIAAYALEDYQLFVGWLWQAANVETLIRDFRERGNPWPNAPMREAIFALEIADAGLQSQRPTDREAARRLLLDYALLVRDPIGPGAYERYWLWASILVLEGAKQPLAALQMIDLALERFPAEPRFRLARAFALDQRRPLDDLARNGTILANAVRHVAEVSAAYEAAMPSPETAAEARLRQGWLLRRAGRHADALALVEAVGPLADTFLDYMRHLMRGHLLAALGRLDAAGDAYLAALDQFPTAQSARVGLMATRQRQGDHAAAYQLAEAIQMAGPDAGDPWWRYWQGDYRLLATVFSRLREYGR